MSKIEVNAIEPQCGTTLTVGASGDTITFPTGTTIVNNGTQTGFGRTGTVDWQTTKKTADFTAVNGEGYFVDTGGGAVIATLPASPAAGNIVYIKDYDGNFSTAACTVARNGSNIRGGTNDFLLKINNSGAVFIYVDATEGWQVFVDGSDSDAAPTFITATGGTITTSGNYKIHSFTGPGTFTVCSISDQDENNEVSYMAVAGGGGGGTVGGGGGGAGGFRESKSGVDGYTASPIEGSTPITVTATSFPITVGGGGAPSCGSSPNIGVRGAPGTNSTFSTITSAGGGGGGSRTCTPTPRAGDAGGSGGGAGRDSGPSDLSGAGNTPPVSPAQGFKGGYATNASATAAGGGGGAGAVGANGNPNDSAGPSSTGAAGNGGAGVATSITASSVTRAGGGGGGSNNANVPLRGIGGSGGGGDGGLDGTDGGSCAPATAGTINTGGGGGGGSQLTSGVGSAKGGAGGAGIVIIRYKFQ